MTCYANSRKVVTGNRTGDGISALAAQSYDVVGNRLDQSKVTRAKRITIDTYRKRYRAKT